MGTEVILNSENFKEEVLDSDKPVLVDFWAEWCIPCKMVEPILEEIAETYKDTLKVGKLEVDSAGEIASEYNIISIPTLMIFKDGKPVHQQVGALPKAAIEDMLKDFI